MDRRTLLRGLGIGGAALATAHPVLARPGLRTGQATEDDPPTTGFEDTNGERWTTHEEELDFLAAVAERSPRVAVEVIGETSEGRPLHIVRLGDPAPPTVGQAWAKPVLMHLGCQHGNEPAGREAVLSYLRDLAFTDDPTLSAQLRDQIILVNPTTNPDGRARNIRTNGTMDINRDHLGLTQPETQAVHRVMRDWQPDVMLDHHEYGPSLPVLYDAEILYLWPRNLNVDPQVRDLARTLCEHYIAKGARGEGYTADEYGVYKLGEQPITQTAGGPDEGISRNATGLRHTLGVLIESAVTQSLTRPGELVDDAAHRRRRAASQYQTVMDTLRFMREQGDLAKFASDGARVRAAAQGRDQAVPVYFGGADNEEPSASDIDDPPPCRYDVAASVADGLAKTFALHGIATQTRADHVEVAMGQAARPVIPLLLDGRGSRNVASDQPVYVCA